ncbi:MAG: TIR domain-containing protein [Candidatus Methanofastidiosa archaeon]|nr:TIR domain-containing protein [Candidatus Methanofastidiosa archaeon]
MKEYQRVNSPLVFISYNKADKDVSREIALFLASVNINVWFDEWEVSAGDSIVEQINKGLHDCTHFIIIWSKNASTSNWVRKELQSILIKAIQSGKLRILPIVLDETPPPEIISDIYYIRYRGGIEEDRWEIIRAITGHDPSYTFIKAIVKKYHEVIYDPNAKDPFGIIACPKCGSKRLKGSSYIDYVHDKVYYILACEECGWSDWTQ